MTGTPLRVPAGATATVPAGKPATVPAGKSAPTTAAPGPAPTFGGVLRSREFRWLWLAGAQSLLGDQLARVALTILVYDRTRSALATAAVYALTFLPALVGNLALGPVADRLPPRLLLVGGDLVRAGLLATMAMPHLPIPALMVLLSVAVFVGAPWQSAETALVADLVAETDYALGLGLRTATMQATQLVGFAVGGLVVGLLGARTALAIDAVTFAISAVVIRIGVRARPAGEETDSDDNAERRRWFSAVGTVFGDPRLRTLLGFSALLGLLVVPEGVAAPFAHTLHAGAAAVGLLLASGPAGVLVGSLLFSRWVPRAKRARLLGPLAAASGLPLLAAAFIPSLPVTLALWALSGAATSYHIEVIAEYVTTLAPGRRVQGLGLLSAALLAAQGVGLLAGGTLSQWIGPAAAIGAAGACASTIAVLLSMARARAAAAVA